MNERLPEAIWAGPTTPGPTRPSHDFPDDPVFRPFRLAWQYEVEILELGARPGFPNELGDQLPLGQSLQPLDLGVTSLFAQGGHEALGGKNLSPGSPQDARVQ